MGTSVNMMDAQAQALQDATRIADAQMTQAAILKPVQKSKPIGRPTIKVQKGPATKGTVNAPELQHASEVKKINKAIGNYISALNAAIYHGKSTMSEEWFCELI